MKLDYMGPTFLSSSKFEPSENWKATRKMIGHVKRSCCQTLGLVLRLRVDFVLPLSQQQEEEEPLTKIYHQGEC